MSRRERARWALGGLLFVQHCLLGWVVMTAWVFSISPTAEGRLWAPVMATYLGTLVLGPGLVAAACLQAGLHARVSRAAELVLVALGSSVVLGLWWLAWLGPQLFLVPWALGVGLVLAATGALTVAPLLRRARAGERRALGAAAG